MKKLFLMFVFTCACAFAQSHSVTLNGTDTGNPVGTTYDMYRLTGNCPATAPTTTAGFTLLNSTAIPGTGSVGSITFTYVDNTVAGGLTYCYIATAVPSGGGTQSSPSPDAQSAVPSVVAPSMLQVTVVK
jgi:hypothetical protein